MTEAEPEQSVPKLRAAEVDLAIVFDYPMLPAQDDERDVERALLLTESMYLALPRDHALAEAEVVRLADLADEAWLCGVCPSSCGDVVKQACRQAGFDPGIGFESDEYQVLQAYVAAGLGFTLLPDLALPTLRPDLVVRPTTARGAQAAGVGRDAGRGRPLAGDRGDGGDPARGRPALRRPERHGPRGVSGPGLARRGFERGRLDARGVDDHGVPARASGLLK